jgi:hypothetical protein
LVYFSIGKFQKVKIFLKKQEIKTPNESFPYKMEENGGRFFENRRTEHKKSGEYGNRTSAVCPNSVQSETARGLTARGE